MCVCEICDCACVMMCVVLARNVWRECVVRAGRAQRCFERPEEKRWMAVWIFSGVLLVAGWRERESWCAED